MAVLQFKKSVASDEGRQRQAALLAFSAFCPLKTAPPDKAFNASCCFCGCIIVAMTIKIETMISSVITKLYNALPPIHTYDLLTKFITNY